MMTERPKIKIVPDAADKMITALSIILFLAITAFTIWLYSISPEKVPAHFDINGNINRYDSKGTLFVMPAIALALLLLFTLLARVPHIYNYPQNTTEENAPAMYRQGAKMMRYLSLGSMFLFCFIQYEVYLGITNKYLPFHWWQLVLVLLLTMGLPIFFGLRGSKKN